MCNGECPYCERLFEDKDYEVLKAVLEEYMIKEHYDALLKESRNMSTVVYLGRMCVLNGLRG